MEFGLTIAGDREVTLRFEQFPVFAHDRLLAAMQDIERRLEAAVLAAEPTRTGRLRSQTGGRVYDHGNRIAAVVGVRAETQGDAIKAAALEYGAHKAIMVKAHQARLDHIWSRAINPIKVTVPDHSRTPNIAAQSFLRGPAADIRDGAFADLRAALEQAATEASA